MTNNIQWEDLASLWILRACSMLIRVDHKRTSALLMDYQIRRATKQSSSRDTTINDAAFCRMICLTSLSYHTTPCHQLLPKENPSAGAQSRPDLLCCALLYSSVYFKPIFVQIDHAPCLIFLRLFFLSLLYKCCFQVFAEFCEPSGSSIVFL